MKRYVVPICMLVSLALLTGCTMWRTKPVKAWSQATGGEHLVRLFWRDIKTQDVADLEQHMSATFVLLTPLGPFNREQTLEHIKHVQLEDYNLGNFQVQPNGPDMVVTFTAQLRGMSEGRQIPDQPFHMMIVWQQAKKGWIATAFAEIPEK